MKCDNLVTIKCPCMKCENIVTIIRGTAPRFCAECSNIDPDGIPWKGLCNCTCPGCAESEHSQSDDNEQNVITGNGDQLVSLERERNISEQSLNNEPEENPQEDGTITAEQIAFWQDAPPYDPTNNVIGQGPSLRRTTGYQSGDSQSWSSSYSLQFCESSSEDMQMPLN